MEVNYLDLGGEGYMGSMQWQLGREMGTIPAFLILSAHESGKVVSSTHRPPLSAGDIPGTHFCRHQGHSVAGSIKSMKNLNDPIGKRTPDLPAFMAVSLPHIILTQLLINSSNAPSVFYCDPVEIGVTTALRARYPPSGGTSL